MSSGQFSKFNWRDSKFGMFIHWGLYAAISRGEWYMYGKRVPVKEYEKNAETFNPLKFNAREWVSLAKNAGMKYIVITAKHHDGFAMYDSKADPYNIVERTPFKRDPMIELREECDRQGIQLCFYYSHVIDWHHPHALHESANNTWDFDLESKDFYTYWNNKSKPQVKELLENYGPIGLLWFDTAGNISKEDSLDMYNMVKSIQPNCLVNSRLSHVPGMGDYAEKGDNEIPMLGDDERAWQTPMTLNQSWGYEEREQNWKEPKLLIYKLINIISKGGNFLLNVGPTAEGIIPEESVTRLLEVGAWISGREESIYQTDRTPFSYEHDWGGITARHNKLYLHLFNEKVQEMKQISLAGLDNKVNKIYFLTSKENLNYKQSCIDELSLNVLDISLPDILPDKYVTTVVLELDGTPVADSRIVQQRHSVCLDLPAAKLKDKKSEDDIDGWKTAEWDFLMLEEGEYTVELINFKKFNAEWDYSEVSVTFEGREVCLKPSEDYTETDSPSCQHPYCLVRSHILNIHINKPGLHTISLKGEYVGKKPRNFEAWQAPKYRIRSLLITRK